MRKGETLDPIQVRQPAGPVAAMRASPRMASALAAPIEAPLPFGPLRRTHPPGLKQLTRARA